MKTRAYLVASYISASQFFVSSLRSLPALELTRRSATRKAVLAIDRRDDAHFVIILRSIHVNDQSAAVSALNSDAAGVQMVVLVLHSVIKLIGMLRVDARERHILRPAVTSRLQPSSWKWMCLVEFSDK